MGASVKCDARILSELQELKATSISMNEKLNQISTTLGRMDEKIIQCKVDIATQDRSLQTIHKEIYGEAGNGEGLKERIGKVEEKTDTIWKVAIGAISTGLASFCATIGRIMGVI